MVEDAASGESGIAAWNDEKDKLERWIASMASADPNWRISRQRVDPGRMGSIFLRFEQYEADHPLWVRHIDCALPTYYGILCVTRKDPQDIIRENYEKKKLNSIYPDDAIDEAYNVLSNPEQRAKYDRFLQSWEMLSRGFEFKLRTEMIADHSNWLSREKKFVTMKYIMAEHGDWLVMTLKEMPTFYEILGLEAEMDATREKINRVFEAEKAKAKDGLTEDRLELTELAHSVLSNDQLRMEYDIILNFISGKGCCVKTGKKMVFSDSAILSMLKEYRLDKILKDHPDWKMYLGDCRGKDKDMGKGKGKGKKTFYDVLGIDADSLPSGEADAQAIIREKFKNLEKTPVVNLAYTALKNSKMHRDYCWLLKNQRLRLKKSRITFTAKDFIDMDRAMENLLE